MSYSPEEHLQYFGLARNEQRLIRLGRCLVAPGSRALLRDGAPVDIGSRAFDLLMVLLRSRGDLVSKEVITRSVWPSTLVEESNLRFQMATLRKALGQDASLIKTIPGRGYMIVADDESAVSDAPSIKPSPQPRAPADAASTIFIIEEDRELRDALMRVLRPFAACVLSFGSIEALRSDQAAGNAA